MLELLFKNPISVGICPFYFKIFLISLVVLCNPFAIQMCVVYFPCNFKYSRLPLVFPSSFTTPLLVKILGIISVFLNLLRVVL